MEGSPNFSNMKVICSLAGDLCSLCALIALVYRILV